MDFQAIDFDNLYEDVTTEVKEFLNSSLKETLKGFAVALEEHASQKLASPDPFNRMVAEFGCCPPPKIASLASFDDLVIKLLGDRGGSDEQLWKFSEKLPSRPTTNHPLLNGAKAGSGTTAQAENNVSQDPAHNETDNTHDQIMNPQLENAQDETEASPRARESAETADHGSTAESSASEAIGPSSATQINALPELVYRYWPGVADSLRALLHSSTAGTDGDAGLEALAVQPEDPTSAVKGVASILRQSESQQQLVAQANGEVNVALGKRGRYFLDVWEEEDFLQRYKLKRFRPLRSWDDLFREGYSDNHDGCYRDWLQAKQMETKARLQGLKVGRKKQKSDPIFRSAVMTPYDTTKLRSIVPPPVPVAIHHPAAWGVRPVWKAGEAGDASCVHPASIRGERRVQPQHEKHLPAAARPAHAVGGADKSDSKGHKGGQGHGRASGAGEVPVVVPYTDLKAARRKYGNQLAVAKLLEEGGAAAAVRAALESGVEDVDDFNLYAAQVQRRLQAEEACNFVRLARLQQAVKMHEPLDQLAARRERLEQVVHKAVRRMEPCSVDRVVYAYKPAKSQTLAQPTAGLNRSGSGRCLVNGAESSGCEVREDVIRLDVFGNVLPRSGAADGTTGATNGQNRYNTRCVNSESIVAALRPNDASANYRRELLGASAMRQVLHGGLLAMCLQVDAEVEVYLDRRWQIATITRIVYDGDLARHVKVIPEDCTAAESAWISVEDGRLAPCGTHLRLIKQPTATVSAVQAASSSSSASAAVPVGGLVRTVSERSSVEDLQAIDATEADKAGASKVEAAATNAHTVTPEESSPFKSQSAAPPPANSAQISKRKADAISPEQPGGQARKGSPPDLPTGSAALLPPQLDPRLRRFIASNAAFQATGNGFLPTNSGFVNVPTDDRKSTLPSGPNGSSPPDARPTSAVAGVVPSAVGGTAVAPSSSQKVKLSLPLGASSERERIPAVKPYTPLTFLPQPLPFMLPYAPHPYFGQPIPPNVPTAATATAAAMGGVSPVFTGYECEPETDPRQNYMLLDPLGMRSLYELHQRVTSPTSSRTNIPANGHTVSHVRGPPASLISPQAYTLPVSSDSTSSSSAASTTFRLGPRGSITKNG